MGALPQLQGPAAFCLLQLMRTEMQHKRCTVS
jgi:hypothetical protein